MDDLSNLVAQRWREGGPNPAPRPAVPDMAIRYFHVEHLFKAQRLSAELQISCQPMPDLCLLFIHPPAPWVGSQPCGAK